MIVVLSPSKSMDMESTHGVDFTQPAFLDRSQKLVTKMRRVPAKGLMELMEIGKGLADLNRQRFQDWEPPFSTDNAKQAMYAFTGDVYDGLDPATLKKRDVKFAQDHLRILSGLYGLLKPLDLIQPYRLEMGRPVATRGAKNLYQFWQSTVTAELNDSGTDLLVNLASQEYFKAVDKKTLEATVVTPVFKDENKGTFKTIGFLAKRARGVMARYIVRNRLTEAERLLGFAEEGYEHDPELSEPLQPVFTRTKAAAAAAG